VQFVAVAQDVRLEVLDWGGTGRPLVLLAGGGNTAHIYDEFAPKLTASYHVYGITRRGFGASDFSATDDPADRLGDDVVVVIDALKLDRPVLVGHSLAGVELSSVANRYPDRVAGLVYLDAAYSYAFDNGKGADVMETQRLKAPSPPSPGKSDLASFPAFMKYQKRINGFRFSEAELRQQRITTPAGEVGKERNFPGSALFMPLLTNTRKYTAIPVPALVIFVNPHGLGTWVNSNTDPTVQTAVKSYSSTLSALTEKQEKAVENGVPTAHVITLPGASHHLFLSNAADVIREMQNFLNTLK
jgi:pimeloyl-ACP methyl ester carboxylesterase